jgi:hypothetical protein
VCCDRNNGWRVHCNYDRVSTWSLNRVSHFLLQGTTMKVAVASAVMLAVLGLVQGHSYHLGATCPNVEPVSNFNLDKVSRLVILKSNRDAWYISSWPHQMGPSTFCDGRVCRVSYFEHTLIYLLCCLLFVKRTHHLIRSLIFLKCPFVYSMTLELLMCEGH